MITSTSLPRFPRDYTVPTVALLLLAALLSSGGNMPVFLFFNQPASPAVAALWAHWTVLGDALLLMVLTLVFVGRRPDVVWAVWVAAIVTTLAVHGLKLWLAVPRPPALLDPAHLQVVGQVLRGESFPSGHTTAAFAFAGVLILSLRRVWMTVLMLSVALGVGISRMAVGAHWPVDVLTGAALGWLGACAAMVLTQRWAWGLSLTAQRIMAALLVTAALVMLWGHDSGYPQTAIMQRALALLALAVGAPGLIRLARGR